MYSSYVLPNVKNIYFDSTHFISVISSVTSIKRHCAQFPMMEYFELRCFVTFCISIVVNDAFPYEPGLFTLKDLQRQGVTRLSHKSFITVPHSITSMKIKANVQVIDPGIFTIFPKLKNIDLSGNCIKQISSNIFDNLTHIVKLSLKFNQIR